VAALQPGEIGKHRLGGGGARQHRASLDEEQAPGIGQRDAAADPVEQLRRIALLECGDGGAGRGLREVEMSRRLCDVLMLGDGDEYAKLLKGQSPKRLHEKQHQSQAESRDE
jgi:hypothetical protein